MEVARHEDRVVHHGVELPAAEHDAGGAAEDEGQHGEELRGDAGIAPGQRREPAEQAAPAAQAPGELQAEADGEGGDQARQGDREGQRHEDAAPDRREAGVGELVVRAHRKREQQQQGEGEPRHRVGDQFAAELLREQAVPGDVGRHQPEVDDRMARPPEQGAPNDRVDGLRPVERPGDQHDDELDQSAAAGERPHDHRHRAHVGDERRHLTGPTRLPAPAQVEKDRQRQQAADHHQRHADVEQRAPLERGIEGPQHARRVVEHGDEQQSRPHRHQGEAGTPQRHVGGEAEFARRQVDQHSAGDEEGKDVGVEHAVDRQALVVGLQHRAQGGIGVDAAVVQRLQRPDRGADHQGGEAEDEEGEHGAPLGGDGVLARQNEGGFARSVDGEGHEALLRVAGLAAGAVVGLVAMLGAGSTTIVPTIAWCSMPQYSLQTMFRMPGFLKV